MFANYVLLYVDNVSRSRDFYAGIFGAMPVEDSPTFSLFILPSGLKFGLWKKSDVIPEATANAPAGVELGFPVETGSEVDDTQNRWSAAGMNIIQSVTDMDFGRTFTAEDPDGHRLRVFHVTGG